MHDIALLVPSCDRYSDLWEPFFLNLKKKWPNLPFRVCLVANEKPFQFPGVEVIHVAGTERVVHEPADEPGTGQRRGGLPPHRRPFLH